MHTKQYPTQRHAKNAGIANNGRSQVWWKPTRHCAKLNMAHLKSVLTDDRELFGPLTKSLLLQQEGTDTAIPHWGHGVLL